MKPKGFFNTFLTIGTGMMLMVALAASQSAWAQNSQKSPKVYRWVDENGEVHYSETLPPDWDSESHDELNRHGIVTEEGVKRAPDPVPVPESPKVVEDKGELPRDKSGLKRPEPLYSEAEKQQRMDRLLMLRYRSEAELVEAMDVEIRQLEYDERLLNASQASLESSLRAGVAVAGDRQRAGLEVKPETLEEIAGVRTRLKENRRSLQGLKQREQNIREGFARDIARYRELTELYSEEES